MQAVGGNHVSAAVLAAILPIIKVEGNDKYMIGTEVRKIEMRGESLVVRVAGGYQLLSSFINKEAIP